jgi:hypothetical protein
MKEELFEQLIQSAREGGAILRGHMTSARKTSVERGKVMQTQENMEGRVNASPTEMQWAKKVGEITNKRLSQRDSALGVRVGPHLPSSRSAGRKRYTVLHKPLQLR